MPPAATSHPAVRPSPTRTTARYGSAAYCECRAPISKACGRASRQQARSSHHDTSMGLCRCSVSGRIRRGSGLDARRLHFEGPRDLHGSRCDRTTPDRACGAAARYSRIGRHRARIYSPGVRTRLARRTSGTRWLWIPIPSSRSPYGQARWEPGTARPDGRTMHGHRRSALIRRRYTGSARAMSLWSRSSSANPPRRSRASARESGEDVRHRDLSGAGLPTDHLQGRPHTVVARYAAEPEREDHTITGAPEL